MAALIAFFLGFVSSDRWSVSLSAVCLDPSRLASVTVSVTRRTSKVVTVLGLSIVVLCFVDLMRFPFDYFQFMRLE